MEKCYICCDLKSFYASVECVERGLDPMTTNLVVADPERSDKTICLAITPAMKKLGIKNRCRIFEIPKGVEYIIAAPRMKRYIDYSADIYEIYLGFFSKDDIYVYSIDEVFINIAPYMKKYGLTEREISIIDYLMKRKSNLEIAESLFISEKTVKTHVSNIIRKMNVKNRIDVMLACQELDAEEITR